MTTKEATMPNPLTSATLASYQSKALAVYRERGCALRHTVTVGGPAPNMEPATGFDFVDSLDTLRDPNTRLVTACAGAYDLGRKVDERILRCLEAVAPRPGFGQGLTLHRAAETSAYLRCMDRPDEEFFAPVGARQWLELWAIPQFRESYRAEDRHPWLKGTESRTWLGITWCFHTGLPKHGGLRVVPIYSQSAVALAEGDGLEVTFHADPNKAAVRLVHTLLCRAVLTSMVDVVALGCWEGE